MIDRLLRHQAWADAELHAHAAAADAARADAGLIALLHHMAVVQEAFLLCCREQPFDLQAARSSSPESLEQVRAMAKSAASGWVAYAPELTAPALEQRVLLPWRPGVESARGDLVLQVVLHTQNHRGQCLARLRELGCAAPALDYIIWTRETPSPRWPE